MSPLAKVGLVAGGYVGAFALAAGVVIAYVAATSGPDRQQYGAMFAFGDSLLFLAVFGVAALMPFGTALFFLRPYRTAWRILSVAALTVAATAGAMVIGASGADSAAGPWMALIGLLRLLVSPFFAMACLAAVVLAPGSGPRRVLLVAALIELSVFVWVAVSWFLRVRPPVS